MLHKLRDEMRMRGLPQERSWLRDAGEMEVKLWLSICGDTLASISGLIEGKVRTQEGIMCACLLRCCSKPMAFSTVELESLCTATEQWLRGEMIGIKTSRSKLLRDLATAGEDNSVPPGSVVVTVVEDTPEDKELQTWQRLNILRRDNDAERRLCESGKKVYTWHHATLRLSAALAFGKKFRPLVRSGCFRRHPTLISVSRCIFSPFVAVCYRTPMWLPCCRQ